MYQILQWDSAPVYNEDCSGLLPEKLEKLSYEQRISGSQAPQKLEILSALLDLWMRLWWKAVSKSDKGNFEILVF